MRRIPDDAKFRCRLNEKGAAAFPRSSEQDGIAWRHPGGGPLIQVVWDGNKSPTTFHESFIAAIPR